MNYLLNAVWEVLEGISCVFKMCYRLAGLMSFV